MIKKGDWVQVETVVLSPEKRTANIPDDTKHVPLKMWVKGRLQNESAELGDEVSVITRTNRLVSGTLCAVNPSYSHSFGDFIPELQQVDDMVKSIVFGGEKDEG
ncbi:MAG: 2-amino-4-oxopentanoate thiolase subunit OrtA [Clostridia bacterium]|nr:2-amino-4-oxopentanoate thiolase subunit OrtA [Clostridia bacterium]